MGKYTAYVLAILISAALLSISPGISLAGDGKSSSAASDSAKGSWKRVMHFKKDTDLQGAVVDFKTGAPRWRIRWTGGLLKRPGSSATAAKLRLALMKVVAEDSKGFPKSWKQLELLADGKPTDVEQIKEYNGKVDPDAKPTRFGLSVTGQFSTYSIYVEEWKADDAQ